jgi:hypothetical protein
LGTPTANIIHNAIINKIIDKFDLWFGNKYIKITNIINYLFNFYFYFKKNWIAIYTVYYFIMLTIK